MHTCTRIICGQQTSANVVVVQQQPQVIRPAPPVQNSSIDNSMTFALIVTILFLVFGCWWTLFCSIPAIIFASMVRKMD